MNSKVKKSNNASIQVAYGKDKLTSLSKIHAHHSSKKILKKVSTEKE
jgi:hypothetical protein